MEQEELKNYLFEQRNLAAERLAKARVEVDLAFWNKELLDRLVTQELDSPRVPTLRELVRTHAPTAE